MRKATNERREDLMRVLAMSALACTLVPGLSATAEARSLLDKLRSCLELKDMTKQRLDCYDAILPPQANPMPVPAKVVTDCRFSGRLGLGTSATAADHSGL